MPTTIETRHSPNETANTEHKNRTIYFPTLDYIPVPENENVRFWFSHINKRIGNDDDNDKTGDGDDEYENLYCGTVIHHHHVHDDRNKAFTKRDNKYQTQKPNNLFSDTGLYPSVGK